MKNRKTTGFKQKAPTRDELNQALAEFKKRGGTIQRIEPLWIDDPHPIDYQTDRHQ